MECEFIKDPCFICGKVCSERAEFCKRRKLKLKGMTDEQIDILWNVPEKYRVNQSPVST